MTAPRIPADTCRRACAAIGCDCLERKGDKKRRAACGWPDTGNGCHNPARRESWAAVMAEMNGEQKQEGSENGR